MRKRAKVMDAFKNMPKEFDAMVSYKVRGRVLVHSWSTLGAPLLQSSEVVGKANTGGVHLPHCVQKMDAGRDGSGAALELTSALEAYGFTVFLVSPGTGRLYLDVRCMAVNYHAGSSLCVSLSRLSG